MAKRTNRENRKYLFLKQGGRCFYCCRKTCLNKSKLKKSMTVDHVIPKSIEVIDCKSNYVGACLLCNSEKSSKSFSSFVRDKRSSEIKVAIELIQEFKKAPSYIKSIKSRANYNKSISALRFELNERSSELRPRIKVIEHHCKIINKIMEKR